MVTFAQSYSYNRQFDGSHNVEVALSENEFDIPAIDHDILIDRLQNYTGIQGRL